MKRNIVYWDQIGLVMLFGVGITSIWIIPEVMVRFFLTVLTVLTGVVCWWAISEK